MKTRRNCKISYICIFLWLLKKKKNSGAATDQYVLNTQPSPCRFFPQWRGENAQCAPYPIPCAVFPSLTYTCQPSQSYSIYLKSQRQDLSIPICKIGNSLAIVLLCWAPFEITFSFIILYCVRSTFNIGGSGNYTCTSLQLFP